MAWVAGPLLIVGAVLLVLHRLVLAGKLSSQHPDVLAYWLPTYCFLGRNLAAAHIPAWNPYAMGGVPFAADPQSGWIYAPAMLLFSVLPCDVAMRAMIVLQPLLAGLGLYWFLRSEGLSRPAATVGGLALAVPLASSRLGQFLPFPSAFAWMALMLGACSRLVRASTVPRRLLWVLLTALAWGQLAAAYFAHLLILGTVALALFLAAKGRQNVRSGLWSRRRALGLAGLLALSLPLVNLAYLLPRLAYLPHTSFSLGSAGLAQGSGVAAAWPLILGTAPGYFCGMASLALVFAGWRVHALRPLFAAFAAFGALSYLAGEASVARGIDRIVRGIPGLRFYTHYPSRFSMGVLLAIPVLAALGTEAWRRAGPSLPGWLPILAAPAVLWLALPPLFGVPVATLVIPWAGAAAAGAALTASAGRPRLALLLPVALVLEVTIAGVAGQSPGRFGLSGALHADPLHARGTGWFVPLARATVDGAAYLRPGPIAVALRRAQGRFLSFDPEVVTHRGYLLLQGRRYWGLTANQRGMLFGARDAQGYNPVQLSRYWTFVRAVSPRPMDYTAAVFSAPPPVALDLLGVTMLVTPARRPLDPGAAPIAREGSWVASLRAERAPAAEFLSSWRTVPDGPAALRAVLAPTFEPGREAVLEAGGGEVPSRSPTAGSVPGAVRYSERSAQSARIGVAGPSAGVVLIRTPFDSSWHATLDGRAAPVLRADYLDMAVAVPPGRHTIDLSYDDPWIGYGLLGSALAVGGLLAWAALTRRRVGEGVG